MITLFRDFLQLTGVVWWACVIVLGLLLGAVELRRRTERREALRVVRRTRPAPTTPASPQAVARDYSHRERPGHAEPNQSGPPAA